MNMIKHLPANTAGRDFVVGDIHGCFDELGILLELAKFDPESDRLICTGDLIDRGPRSADVLRLLSTNWFHSVMGNHESMMINGMADWNSWEHTEMWMSNGGLWARGHTYAELCDLAALIIDLPLCIAVADRFLVLHAEWHGSLSELLAGNYTQQQIMSMLWGRDVLRGYVVPALIECPVYVGHSIVGQVTERGAFRYIDTGSFLERSGRGCMTMVEPATGKVWSTRQPSPVLDWDFAS